MPLTTPASRWVPRNAASGSSVDCNPTLQVMGYPTPFPTFYGLVTVWTESFGTSCLPLHDHAYHPGYLKGWLHTCDAFSSGATGRRKAPNDHRSLRRRCCSPDDMQYHRLKPDVVWCPHGGRTYGRTCGRLPHPSHRTYLRDNGPLILPSRPALRTYWVPDYLPTYHLLFAATFDAAIHPPPPGLPRR